jgi:pimeloyl-ACP methyl ester carboxylesterase
VRIALVVMAAGLGSLLPAASASAQSQYAPVDRAGPALSVPDANLRGALSCSPGIAHASRNPILLIPGTNLDPGPNFSWNYQRAFNALGWPYCMVTLPEHTLGDIQVAGEYVVYALRTMSRQAGRKVNVLGFSQGGMLTRWALRFWPDTRQLVEDLVGLDPSNHGTLDADASCNVPCPAADWQQASMAHFIEALNSRTETFAGIDYTVIFSRTDEIVVPNFDASGSSSLHNGSGRIANIAVQEICPGDTSEHLAMGSYDAVGYALAVDALTHGGTGDRGRIPATVCAQPFQPGVNPATFPTDYAGYLQAVGSAQQEAATLTSEPPLRCYVFASCPQGFAQATCLDARGAASGKRLGPVGLGRPRSLVRSALGPRRNRRTRAGLDRYCVSGGGILETGYPTARLARHTPRALRGHSILVLASSPRFSVRGIRRGTTVTSLRRKLRGERRYRVGRNTWYLARGRKATLVFKTRGGRVLAVGLAARSGTGGSAASRRFLRAWQL